MRRETYNDLRMHRKVPARTQDRPDDPRQAQRRKRGKQRRTDRNCPDERSVRIDAPSEQQSQEHGGPARQRRGQQQKRQRSPCACASEQQKRRRKEARDLKRRFIERRPIKQRNQRIDRAEQRNGDGRQDTDPHAHPCCRDQIHAAIHQRVVEKEQFDCNLHATLITITVISSEPPRSSASFRSASPVCRVSPSDMRIAFSTPSGNTS